jgi:hypothetical protein
MNTYVEMLSVMAPFFLGGQSWLIGLHVRDRGGDGRKRNHWIFICVTFLRFLSSFPPFPGTP